ncbi:MAG: hypothetical protein SCAL_000266 [Candidatus Syntrophoarchaeum caldarius]|uniref:Uncharacterized protein n=1 Tax=Candidatus Syntropharchaeum caldarium TaxID=1838285 RepID=A0A1F2PB13_9EURY|nr:MAG: hypothetical protein SCAL_000266 [Candidatus Syntrophoarchaeum caldarius]
MKKSLNSLADATISILRIPRGGFLTTSGKERPEIVDAI